MYTGCQSRGNRHLPKKTVVCFSPFGSLYSEILYFTLLVCSILWLLLYIFTSESNVWSCHKEGGGCLVTWISLLPAFSHHIFTLFPCSNLLISLPGPASLFFPGWMNFPSQDCRVTALKLFRDKTLHVCLFLTMLYIKKTLAVWLLKPFSHLCKLHQ